jgi:hypothetical protein
MRMMLQSLVPGMEHAEEDNLHAEVTRIAGDLKQGLSTGVKAGCSPIRSPSHAS